ncbi:nitrous oxide reductase accessory protein NosL [Roseicella frigidaeris]|uniref:Copper resistance protein CopZ n=1 Tax=Roseicella frigidaeris TaxID=2230885 RepID=A0A327M481_9PROT|nr:nitrous oxide reductase accessory protein NosL [Roseicella frigidaeris]RAI57084.1 copper resistance protein CopZ [Roseicella frigidaeris]
MRRLPVLLMLLALLPAACDDETTAAKAPPPVALTREAIGHYCGMALLEHPGPKGQILLRGDDRPIWFTSARDTVAFTLLDEESKAIRAIYVSDMGTAPSWDQPGPDNWVEARRAWFVLGSDRRGGMGAEEAVPFSDRAAADRFVAQHGGRALRLAELPRDWVLGDVGGGAEAGATPAPAVEHAHEGHQHGAPAPAPQAH